MDLKKKAVETLLSVIPVVVLVLILHFTVIPMGAYMGHFLAGTVLLFAGLTVFLSGADVGFSPVGERLGATLANKKSIALMLLLGFLLGFGVTFAEPDVNVLVNQVHSMNSGIGSTLLKFLISTGLGLLIDLGLLRTIMRWKLNRVLIVLYSAVLVLILVAGQKMASIAFDASGSTTGPLAVPLILAIGLGVSQASSGGPEDSFGLTGIASAGPVFAVLFLALFSGSEAGSASFVAGSVHSMTIGSVFLSVLKHTAAGFAPLVVLILVLQVTLLGFPPVKFRIICLGIVYGFFGIVVFLTGVEYGFAPVGRMLGSVFGILFPNFPVPCLLAFLLGAISVIAEPAVWVLTRQVETVTAGRIRKNIVMLALSLGVALCVSLAVLRVYRNINYNLFVWIFVGLSLVLSFFCPPLFTGIAFDSGGVASGPLSTSFILSLVMGLSGSAELGFGVVGMIAMSPLVAIQVLGIVYKLKERRLAAQQEAVQQAAEEEVVSDDGSE